MSPSYRWIIPLTYVIDSNTTNVQAKIFSMGDLQGNVRYAIPTFPNAFLTIQTIIVFIFFHVQCQ